MDRPKASTVKRLFNRSGQFCNFQGCREPIVDEHGTVTVDICHIAAASEEGPRFDATQTDEQRYGFDNLILLCPNHHRQIDSRPDAHPASALRQMKEQAASIGTGVSLTDEVAERLVSVLAGGGVRSAVVSIGQVGGQTAQTIVNVSKPSRAISEASKSRMREHLAPYAGASIALASFAGDSEAASFKRQLINVFDRAGWTVIDQSTFTFFGDKTGIVLTIPFGADEDAATTQAAARALDETGQLLDGNRGDMANDAGLYVQIWPARS